MECWSPKSVHTGERESDTMSLSLGAGPHLASPTLSTLKSQNWPKVSRNIKILGSWFKPRKQGVAEAYTTRINTKHSKWPKEMLIFIRTYTIIK